MSKDDFVLLRFVKTQDLDAFLAAIKGLTEAEKEKNCETITDFQIRANKSGHIEIGYFEKEDK